MHKACIVKISVAALLACSNESISAQDLGGGEGGTPFSSLDSTPSHDQQKPRELSKPNEKAGIESESGHSGEDQGIVVVGSRESISPDRRSYDVRTPDASTLEAEDAIARLPGAIVGIDGRLSILGQKEIRYTIDDQPVTSEMAIHLPASLIQRIEVITNPGASSSSSVGVIINIVLKNERNRPEKEIIYRAALSDREQQESSLTLQSKSDRWNILTTLAANYQSMRSRTRISEVFFDPMALDPIGEAHDGNLTQRSQGNVEASVAASRDIGESQRIVIVCSGRKSWQQSHGEQSHTLDEGQGFSISQTFLDKYHFSYDTLNCSPGFLFDKIGNSYYQVSVSFGYLGRESIYRQTAWTPIGTSEFALDQVGTTYRAGLELKRTVEMTPRKKLEFGGGYSTAMISRHYSTEPGMTAGPAFFEQFDRQEREANAWLTYQFPVAKFDFLPGLRLTSLALDHSVDGRPLAGGTRLLRLLPSMHATFQPTGRFILRAAYSEKNLSGAEDYFNPVRMQVGYNQFSIGDQNLHIGRQKQFEFSAEYSRRSFFALARIYARNDLGPIFPVYSYIGSNRFLLKYINAESDNRTGLNLNFKGNISKSINASVDFDIYKTLFKWIDSGEQRVKSTSWSAKWNILYQISNRDNLLFIGQFLNSQSMFYERKSSQISSSMKYSHDFVGGFSISAEVLNFLASDVSISNSKSPVLTQTKETIMPRQAFRLTIVKRF